ncbi:hypothetical protein [Rhizobium mongolense]|uniref:hypothetical protein n=1 Tax=Rhizobium mongolense TaxID=57676 RepID=UPI00111388EB|nr:hypothetical protein [Rhizobium mongolense]
MAAEVPGEIDIALPGCSAHETRFEASPGAIANLKIETERLARDSFYLDESELEALPSTLVGPC